MSDMNPKSHAVMNTSSSSPHLLPEFCDMMGSSLQQVVKDLQRLGSHRINQMMGM